ncbi:hypothetical protein [Sporomusa termitida]|nr:hypothetical protein [Sporomusa termitida]
MAAIVLSVALTTMIIRPVQAVTGQLDKMAAGNYLRRSGRLRV